MPRYFFHHRVGDRMMWDAVGLELPDVKTPPTRIGLRQCGWTSLQAGSNRAKSW